MDVNYGHVITAILLLTCSVHASTRTGKENVNLDLELTLREEGLLYAMKEPPKHRPKRDTEDTFEGSGDAEPEFPSSVPDLGDKPIEFSADFTIENMTVKEFNESDHKEKFLKLLKLYFEKVPAFKNIRIDSIRSGSVILETTTELDPNAANGEAIKDEGWSKIEDRLLNACVALLNSGSYNITNNTEEWRKNLQQVSDQVGEICETVACPWGQEINCSSKMVQCIHVCVGFGCGNGTCLVGANGTPTCRCESDEYYDYSGNDCAIATLRWEMVLAASGGVGGALIVLMGVVLAATCYKRWRGKTSDNLSDAGNSYRSDAGLQGRYRRKSTLASSGRFGISLFRPSFLSRSFDIGTSPDSKLGGRESEWCDSQDSQEDIFPDFTAKLDHIDTNVDYAIARPRIG